MSYTATSIPAFSAVRRQPVAQRSLELKRRHIKQVLILIFIVVVSAVLFVWTRIQVIQLGYEVSRMRKEATDLMERKIALEAEVASLKSPQRLEKVARDVFGMRLPLADEIVFVEKQNNAVGDESGDEGIMDSETQKAAKVLE